MLIQARDSMDPKIVKDYSVIELVKNEVQVNIDKDRKVNNEVVRIQVANKKQILKMVEDVRGKIINKVSYSVEEVIIYGN